MQSFFTLAQRTKSIDVSFQASIESIPEITLSCNVSAKLFTSLQIWEIITNEKS